MPVCEQFSASEARKKFSDVFNLAVYKGPVLITKGDKKVAVVNAELLRLLTEKVAARDLEAARNALRDYEAKGGTSLEQLKKELGIE